MLYLPGQFVGPSVVLRADADLGERLRYFLARGRMHRKTFWRAESDRYQETFPGIWAAGRSSQ